MHFLFHLSLSFVVTHKCGIFLWEGNSCKLLLLGWSYINLYLQGGKPYSFLSLSSSLTDSSATTFQFILNGNTLYSYVRLIFLKVKFVLFPAGWAQKWELAQSDVTMRHQFLINKIKKEPSFEWIEQCELSLPRSEQRHSPYKASFLHILQINRWGKLSTH